MRFFFYSYAFEGGHGMGAIQGEHFDIQEACKAATASGVQKVVILYFRTIEEPTYLSMVALIESRQRETRP